MRLIDADALMNQWCDEMCKPKPNCEEDCAVYDYVRLAPTIEPKRGEWKRRIVDNGFNADWACSECGYRVKTDFVDYNFCPNCGADMREREGE